MISKSLGFSSMIIFECLDIMNDIEMFGMMPTSGMGIGW